MNSRLTEVTPNLTNITIGLIVFPWCRHKEIWLINCLEAYWKECGAKVIYYSDLCLPIPYADIWVQHLDSSLVPDAYQEVITKLPNVVNRNLLDIRKKSFSEHTINEPNDPYGGMILVKSNYNSGGFPELWEDKYNQKKSFFHKMKRCLPITKPKNKKPPYAKYEVYPSLAKVPLHCFNQEQAVVEKFLPQKEGDHYILYMTYLFFDQHITYKMRSREQIIKWKNYESWEHANAQPDILEWAQLHNVEYGKIDYAYYDGKLVVYDINKTPGLGGTSIEQERALSDQIGSAILKALPQPS